MKKLIVFVVVLSFAGAFPVHSMVPYSSICSLLKGKNGWNSSKCEGMNMQNSPMGEMVTAHKAYKKGNKSIEVTVLSGMNAMGMWAPYQTNMQMDAGESFVKMTTIRGYNVAISYDKNKKSGGVVIAFKSKTNPDMVTAVMSFSFSNMGWKEALEFAKGFDWDQIKNLFYK